MSTLVLLVKLAGDIRGTLLLVIASIVERGIGLIWIDFISLKAVYLLLGSNLLIVFIRPR